MAASHSFSNCNCNPSPKSLVFRVSGSVPPTCPLQVRLISLLCSGQEAQEISENSRVASEVPLFRDQTSSSLQLRRLGQGWVCWGFLNLFVLFGVEVQQGHLLLDSLSARQHLVAEDTKGMAAQLQEK